MTRIPRLIAFIVAISLLTLAILFGLRLIFWFIFNNPADPVPTGDLLYSFYLGTKFDLRLTLYVLIPLFVLGWIKPLSPFNNGIAHYFWLGYLVLAASIVLVFYLVDFGHYAYLHKRIDATILRFLANFQTSMTMAWQSYAIIPWSLLFIFLIVLDAWVVNWLMRYFGNLHIAPLKKRHKLWVAPLSFFVFVFAMFGKFSWYPLRWSDAFFSTHAYAAAVASNPILYFANTIKNKEITFDREKTAQYYELMSSYLGVTEPNKETLNFRRAVNPPVRFDKTPNVVMIYLESFAAYKTGAFGNPLDPTPYFDQLHKNGIAFEHFYTPHTGTARSVFAGITGLPDIEPNKTSSRNPLVVEQHTVISHLTNHEKFYFIGGSANWGNIRGILSRNIPGLHLYEEGSYNSPRMDVWGISDLHLFEEANKVLRQQDKPFFAIIQTSGNHRPYHIPEDNRGFQRKHIDKNQLKKAGFISNDEFNSFHFMDHSIAFFMETARKEKYFANTIFVFFGDHGITGYAGEHSKPYLSQLDLSGLQTPLLFYAPKLLGEPRIIQRVASEVDIVPTIASLTGTPYINTTMGRDLLDSKYDDKRYAFTITHSKLSQIGLVSEQFYFRSLEDGSNTELFALDDNQQRKNIIAEHPEIAQQMQQLCFGIYETTKYMLHNNKIKE
jgi:glucan phosphoethanolaminetransferase (alkaline phosphatase superfamily)